MNSTHSNMSSFKMPDIAPHKKYMFISESYKTAKDRNILNKRERCREIIEYRENML